MHNILAQTTFKFLVFLVLGVVGAGAAIVFVWNDIYAVHADNTDLMHERAYAQVRVDQLAQVRAVAGAIAEDREVLDEYLTRESEVIHLLEEIERLGSVTGAGVVIENVEAVSMDLSETEKSVAVVRISISVEGSWSSVIATLELIELVPKFAFVQELAVEVDTATNVWGATIALILPQLQQ